MEYSFDFNPVRSQKLLLVPQLKQALEILGMNFLELSDYLREQVENNPFLETQSYESQCTIDFFSEEKYSEDERSLEKYSEDELSLKQHLRNQLIACGLTKKENAVAEYIIDNTDQNGYLHSDIQEVAGFFNVNRDYVLKVLEILQHFDPPGVCASSLRECLLLQLEQIPAGETSFDALVLVRGYLDFIAKKDITQLVELTGISKIRVCRAVSLIKTLEPLPGRDYYTGRKSDMPLPDVIINKHENEVEAVLNEEAFPELVMVEEFTGNRSIRGIAGGFNISSRYREESLGNAAWLIKIVGQRRKIIYDIAQFIANKEKDFFIKGEKSFKKLAIRDLAEAFNIHETILKQAIRGKHLKCGRELYPFNFFFKYPVTRLEWQ